MVCKHLCVFFAIPTISPFVASSKDSTDFSLFEEGRESESVRAPSHPDCVSLHGIGYTAAGMFCICLSCDTMMYIHMSQRS